MNEINDTLEQLKKQAQEYIEQIMCMKSQDIEKTAYESKAIERNGMTSNAKLLLHLLLIYAVSQVSLRAIAVLGYTIGKVNVSDEAWRQRFLKCGLWISLMLSNALSSLSPGRLVYSYNGTKMQVYLIDATSFKQEGEKGAELRAHMCYNLTKGSMEEVIITDNRVAESAGRFKIKAGELYIGDAGYGKGVNMEYIASHQGYALFRISPNQVKLTLDSKGRNVIDMATKLKTNKKRVVIKCFVHTKNGQYIPVRIIASRLPEDKALLARERKIRASQKRQKQIKEVTLEYSQWVILMTNLDSSYSAESLLQLYRSRWQIELLFKRIKQFFNVKRIKKASLAHTKLLVMLWILIWAAVERKSLEAEIRLLELGEDMNRYSPWCMSMMLFNQFETMLNSLWAFQFDFALHIAVIYRLMRNHKASRQNQYADSRFSELFENLPCSHALPFVAA